MSAAAKQLERAQTDALKGVGAEFKRAASRAVAADLSVSGTPEGFSGWRRGKTVPLEVRDKPYRAGGATGVIVEPTPRSKGPWRVAESGRQAPVQGPFLTKTGRVSRRRGKRYAGASGGFGTWTSTVEAGGRDMPKKVRKEVVSVLKGVFR